MFDDIGRNFLMNPQNGLKVGGERRCPPLFLLMLLVFEQQLTVLLTSVCSRTHTRSAHLWRPIWTGRKTRSCTNCLSTSERLPSLTTSLDSTINTGRGQCQRQFAIDFVLHFCYLILWLISMFRRRSHATVCNQHAFCLRRYLSKRQHHWARTIQDIKAAPDIVTVTCRPFISSPSFQMVQLIQDLTLSQPNTSRLRTELGFPLCLLACLTLPQCHLF